MCEYVCVVLCLRSNLTLLAVLSAYRRESTNAEAPSIPIAWVMQSNWGVNFFSVVFRYILSNDDGTCAPW